MILWPWVAVIIILTIVVGIVARVVNNLNELNAMKNKPSRSGGNNSGESSGGSVRQTKSDMDRFLAEIDRLRKKSTEAPPPPPNKPAPVAPVVQPARPAQKKEEKKPRGRVIAELAEPVRQDLGFAQTPPAPTTGPQPGDLPVTMVVVPPSGTGAPATKVTRIAGRARPVAKTPFAKSITGLLNSGQGLAMAIVLQEILGPPKSKKG